MRFIEKILYFIIFFIPFSFALNAKEGVDLSFLRVAILSAFILTAFIICAHYLKSGDFNKMININKLRNKQTYFLILFLIFSFLSVFWSINPVWSVRKFIFFASIAPIYFLTVYFISSEEKILKSLKYFVFSGFLASLFGVLQFSVQFIYGKNELNSFFSGSISKFLYGRDFGSLVAQNHSWFVNIGGIDYFRAISVFPDPHTFALYLGLLMPIAFCFFMYKKTNKIFAFFTLLIMFLAFLLTFSRGGYLGFLVFFVVTLLLYFGLFKKRINKNTLFTISAVIIALGLIFSGTVFGERLSSSFSMSDISNSGRINIWKVSVEVFKENPLLGAGLGSLPLFFQPSLSIKSPINAHNTYLDIASELGIIGLMLFLAIFFYAFNTLLRNIRMQKEISYLSLGLLGSFVWFLTHSFFETSLFSVPVLTSLLFLIAVAITLETQSPNPNHLEIESPNRRNKL